LLGNALTHGAADKPVALRAFTQDGVLEISVTNSGKPIPAAALGRFSSPSSAGRCDAASKVSVSASTFRPK
jgi:sigma-B regulation protein RsbU (phosphoserine phosphatase)